MLILERSCRKPGHEIQAGDGKGSILLGSSLARQGEEGSDEEARKESAGNPALLMLNPQEV